MPISYVYDTTCTASTGRCCAWVVPDGVQSATFEIWGGGGGGGGGLTMCDCCARTMGGGGGGYALKTVAVTAGDTYTVCAGNGGVDSSATDFGAPIGYCQNGVNGGKSFVTGPAFTALNLTFCATGGTGGCSNFGINCYGHCGCVSDNQGTGVGGDINEQGWPGYKGSSGTNAYSSYTAGGRAGGPGGGMGGWNASGCAAGTASSDINMHGSIPGGGGAGHGTVCCNCCDRGAGRGAPGFVKITW